ncbi:MAG: hypothetical protein ABI140_18265 [Jatrophihabitantaceae bacterium]
MPIPAPIPAALAADLRALTDALDDPAADIAATLQGLGANAGQAVDSYVGLSVGYTGGSRPFSFVLLPEPAPLVRSSLRMSMAGPPLAVLTGVPAIDQAAEIVLVLYAENPGAFVDLAADLGWLTARPGAFDLDLDLDDLPTSSINSGMSALAKQSSIDQALGVLIGLGSTPEQARDELDRAAHTVGSPNFEAALAILSGLRPR